MVFDRSYVEWGGEDFPIYDWIDFYPDTKEESPSNLPYTRPVQMNVFVDANHAGNLFNRQSQTGVLIYLNRAPILWHLKTQRNVESMTFGSDVVVLRIATELIKGLRFKTRIMGCC
jgi:hypothetical protein